MSRLVINGGKALHGTIETSGAKNAALPILAGTILLDGASKLKNVPDLMDVTMMIRMLNALGIWVEHHSCEEVTILNNKKIRHIAPYELVTAMRASFFVAGPILAKTGYAKVPLPGGCSIGSRPVDIHLKGFEALGAKVSFEHGFVGLLASKLKGTDIRLDFPSVGATENIMMAASLAEGTTVITNAAKEPEIDDLAHFLNTAGAKITGIGTDTLVIDGVRSLHGVTYSVIPDRIEAATLLIAGLITRGDVTVTNCRVDHLESLLDVLNQIGCHFECLDPTTVRVLPNGGHRSTRITTEPYPGFPTDMQAQMMALLTLSEGESIVEERIFENRFMHADEMVRMGAQIHIEDHKAIITGVPKLSGADVRISDLRAGAALVLAGLAAEGYTNVYGLKHLERGYANLPSKLRRLGASIVEY